MSSLHYRNTQIEVIQGDITKCEVDAIVNAANNQLILGAGVAGAIARKGGPSIQEECNRHGAIRVGEAAITGAGDLPARYVIHAASMRLGGRATAESLRGSVAHSLRLAEENGVKSIAFPAVGMGIAGFPTQEGSRIMMQTLKEHLGQGSQLEQVLFCLFDDATYQTFVEALKAVFGAGNTERGAEPNV